MTLKDIEKEFDGEFPNYEMLEAVDIDEGQRDVVPIEIEFKEMPNPDKIKSFYRTQITKLLDGLAMEKATESDGWDMEQCCPGDDRASGFNKCRQELLTKIKEIIIPYAK